MTDSARPRSRRPDHSDLGYAYAVGTVNAWYADVYRAYGLALFAPRPGSEASDAWAAVEAEPHHAPRKPRD